MCRTQEVSGSDVTLRSATSRPPRVVKHVKKGLGSALERLMAASESESPNLQHSACFAGQRILHPREQFEGINGPRPLRRGDRKSTRLNSSHQIISYAVFCLKKITHDQSAI